MTKKILGFILLLTAALSIAASPAFAQSPNNMDSILVTSETNYLINPDSSITVESTLVLRSLDKKGELKIPLLPFVYYNSEYYVLEYDTDSVEAFLESKPLEAEIVMDHNPYLVLDQATLVDGVPLAVSYSFSNAIIDGGTGSAYLALDMLYPWGKSEDGATARLVSPPQPFTPSCSGNCSMVADGADVVFSIPGGQGTTIGLLWNANTFLVPNAESTPGYSPGVAVEGMHPALFGLLLLAAGALSVFTTFMIIKAVINTDRDRGILSLQGKQFRSRIK